MDHALADTPATAKPGLLPRLWRGPNEDPRWARPALLALLAVTAALYLWDLGSSGWANSYYSAAVQAGSQSWKAFFFGSFDGASFVSVDKAPGSLWVMELSARIFGVNAWSILAPQAIEGVATVGVVYATIRRWFGAGAGLLAGSIVALTPVAVLMFRFNNPDAFLVLLLTLGAYAMTRALEAGSTKWLVLAFALVGFGFLAKMLQALLVLPAFGLVYLIAGPPKFGRRIVQLVIASCAFVIAALWWVVAVMLTPASSRPYVGGSQNNSLWDLTFGYNGFGRLTGRETGSVGGGGPGTGMWGPTGWYRMFNTSFGGQASWLLPCALLLLVAGLIATIRRARTDRTRAALIMWGAWLLVTGVAFSFGKGIIHEYYTVALAPATGAVIAVGAAHFWARRHEFVSRVVLSAALAVAVWWSYRLLERTPNWHSQLKTYLLIAGIVIGALLLLSPRLMRRGAAAIALAASIVALGGTAAYSLATVAQPHTGALVTAGPAEAGRGGFPGGGGPGRGFGRGGARGLFPGGLPRGAVPPGGFPGAGPTGTLPTGGIASFLRSFGQPPGGRGGPGGIGGLLNGSKPDAALTKVLDTDANKYTWVAATIGANTASGYQLATGDPVMAIGGFNGTDPTPTLAQFQRYVAAGKIHYFISGGGFPGGFGNRADTSSSSEISSWVANNYTATTVGGATLYDLTPSAGGEQ